MYSCTIKILPTVVHYLAKKLLTQKYLELLNHFDLFFLVKIEM